MSNCYRASDNKYNDSPVRMADGRHFTDYRPSCDLNNVIKRDNNILNSFDGRLFLQRNATELMNINKKDACLKNCNRECGPDNNNDLDEQFESTMLPEKYKQVCNNNTCEVVGNDPNGIGLGREYFTKDHQQFLNIANKNLPQNNCNERKDFIDVQASNLNHNLYELRTTP
jgi:hypothetical protein